MNLVPFSAGVRDFSLLYSVKDFSGSNPAFHPIGTKVSSSMVKRTGREAQNSFSSITAINNPWSYTSTPPNRLFHAMLNYAQEQRRRYFLIQRMRPCCRPKHQLQGT
jgi:hypothetical protein